MSTGGSIYLSAIDLCLDQAERIDKLEAQLAKNPDFDTMLGVGDGASVDFIKLFRAKNENLKCSA